MSFKVSVLKTAIKLTPNKMIIWVANIILKDIAKLTDFNFDIDARTVYVEVQLCGETELIEVSLEDFAIISHDESYEFVIAQAKSNRLWLNNLLAKIAGKPWKIPHIPQLAAHIGLIAELFQRENTESEETTE